jgi:hypothetical protein
MDKSDPFSIIDYKKWFVDYPKGTVDDAIWIIGGAFRINEDGKGCVRAGAPSSIRARRQDAPEDGRVQPQPAVGPEG